MYPLVGSVIDMVIDVVVAQKGTLERIVGLWRSVPADFVAVYRSIASN